MAAVAPDVPGLEAVLSVSPRSCEAGAPALPCPARLGRLPVLDLQAGLEGVPGDCLEFAPPRLDDVASYFCTGGTTGAPKIAVRTHNEVANAGSCSDVRPHGGLRAAVLRAAPVPRQREIVTGLMPWSLGGHVVLGTPLGYRTPGLVPLSRASCEHYRLLSFSGVPTVYSALLQVPRRRGCRVAALAFCGAAPMPPEFCGASRTLTGIRSSRATASPRRRASMLNPPARRGRPVPWASACPVRR